MEKQFAVSGLHVKQENEGTRTFLQTCTVVASGKEEAKGRALDFFTEEVQSSQGDGFRLGGNLLVEGPFYRAEDVDKLLEEQKTTSDHSEILAHMVKTQCMKGNYNCNPYMHGMANGMILAKSIMDGTRPDYLPRPDVFLDDMPSPEPDCAPGKPDIVVDYTNENLDVDGKVDCVLSNDWQICEDNA